MQSCLKFAQRASTSCRRLSSLVGSDAKLRSALASRGSTSTLMQSSPVQRSFSTTTQSTEPPSQYAVIDHSEAYEAAMQGPHGKQLALARLEGEGKDELPFDPFAEESLTAIDFDDGEEDGVDKYSDDVQEAEVIDDEVGEGYNDALDSPYNPDGSIRRKPSVLATLSAGFPAGGQFAVIELGGSQHKVTTDDVIVANRLKPIEKFKIGSVHTLTDVMLVGSSHMTLVGMPLVSGAEVDVMVEEITRDSKVIVFKKRRRKHSQRKNGFRRDVTLLRVLDIRMPEEYRDHTHIGREVVDSLEASFVVDDEKAGI